MLQDRLFPAAAPLPLRLLHQKAQQRLKQPDKEGTFTSEPRGAVVSIIHTHTVHVLYQLQSPLHCYGYSRASIGRRFPLFLTVQSYLLVLLLYTNSLFSPSSTQQLRRTCVITGAVVSYGQRLHVRQSYQLHHLFSSRRTSGEKAPLVEEQKAFFSSNTHTLKIDQILNKGCNYFHYHLSIIFSLRVLTFLALVLPESVQN